MFYPNKSHNPPMEVCAWQPCSRWQFWDEMEEFEGERYCDEECIQALVACREEDRMDLEIFEREAMKGEAA